MTPRTVDDFNREYLEVHTAKEELYWSTYMGLQDDASLLERAEERYKGYLSDPGRLREVREALARAREPGERFALEGWERFFATHAVEDAQARALQVRLLELETPLHQARARRPLHYRTAQGEERTGSSNVLAANLAASPDETVRRTSHEALLELERWMLERGFLELVRARNAFARALGFPTYFHYRVYKNERLSVEHLFAVLDGFEALTREACARHLIQLVRTHGEGALLGHNVRYAAAGDVERALDPYLPFARALERWGCSFARMGIGFRGATLQLDLLDRPGKYENGFMHGPFPAFVDRGTWRPARINFTSNATPGQVGSGRRALATLFHEGGHAAHFANIVQAAPCFSHEYPPTSMAYAETQSMFCDSVVGDADWLALYAHSERGERLPEEALRLHLASEHPFRAFMERLLLLVPVFERRLYALEDAALQPEAVLALARRCEQEVLGIACSPRPLLSIPHLLGGESACSYQGYLLAHMAVYQTRGHFLARDGHIADNPRVGPELAEHYWACGNARSHDDTVRSLTGEGLSGRALAEHCNLGVEALWEQARARTQAALRRAPPPPGPVELGARLRVVHGREVIADSEGVSLEATWERFRRWVEQRSVPA